MTCQAAPAGRLARKGPTPPATERNAPNRRHRDMAATRPGKLTSLCLLSPGSNWGRQRRHRRSCRREPCPGCCSRDRIRCRAPRTGSKCICGRLTRPERSRPPPSPPLFHLRKAGVVVRELIQVGPRDLRRHDDVIASDIRLRIARAVLELHVHPHRNCSTSNGAEPQSTPIRSPGVRAWSRVSVNGKSCPHGKSLDSARGWPAPAAAPPAQRACDLPGGIGSDAPMYRSAAGSGHAAMLSQPPEPAVMLEAGRANSTATTRSH